MKAIIDAKEFKRIIDNTKRFVGDAGLALASWIYLEIDAADKYIRATALDGHRISIEYAEVLEVDESFTCFIRPCIPKISKYDAVVDLEVFNQRLYVMVGESIMGYVQPEGDYFEIDKILATMQEGEISCTIGVNAKYLKEAMESISTLTAVKRKIAKIDIRNPNQAIIIRSGEREKRENLKIILPVNISD